MLEKKTTELPDHLKELMQPTPSGVEKLLTAWDGLNVETQLLILAEVDSNVNQTPDYITKKIRVKALESSNPFVRYKAARKIFFSTWKETDDDKLLIEKIENDTNTLVRYSLREDSGSFIFDEVLENADAFFSLPHEERLALVRELEDNGEKIASLISAVIDDDLLRDKVSDVELYEILADYLLNPKFKEHYYSREMGWDGYGEYIKGKDISSLWELTAKLPESISHILINNLPEGSGLQSNAVEGVVNKLSYGELSNLLSRNDISLKKFRKEIFWKDEVEKEVWYNRHLWGEACSSNFTLSDEDFTKIINLPDKEKNERFEALSLWAGDLDIEIYMAIKLFLPDDIDDISFNWERLEKAMEYRIKKVQSDDYAIEILSRIRLLSLANESARWKSLEDTPTSVGFLYDKAIKNNLWQTYLNFREAWRRKHLSINTLPSADYEYEYYFERFNFYKGDNEEGNGFDVIQSIDEKLTELSEAQDDGDLIRGIEEIRVNSSNISKDMRSKINELQEDNVTINENIKKIEKIMYLLIILSIFILLKT